MLLFASGSWVAYAAQTGAAQTGYTAVKTSASAVSATPAGVAGSDPQLLLNQYCVRCHNDKAHTAGLTVQNLSTSDLATGVHKDVWEKILRRLSLGEMPPKGLPRPPQAQVDGFTHWLETSLDTYGAQHPDPGRATLRRMNRAEYAAAVHDLLGVNMDVADQLPADDSGYGFDNIADILTVSPTLMDRYVSVAGKVARQAVGTLSRNDFVASYTPAHDLNVQYRGVPAYNVRASQDLPVDSRGGGAFKYNAPYDGAYTIRVVLNSNQEADELVTKGNTYEVKVNLKAGVRTIGVSFPRSYALDENPMRRYSAVNDPSGVINSVVKPEAPPHPVPMNVQVDGERVQTVSVPSYTTGEFFFEDDYPRNMIKMEVRGPFDIKGQTESASQKKVFICRPSASLSETACARKILTNLGTQAFRRPLTETDIAPLMKVYAAGREGATFNEGVESGVEAILVSPQFLFMQETNAQTASSGIHRITDLELATRLSFFLWSSLPDKELLQVAESGKLHDKAVLERQVTRMLADPKAEALADNFAGQWLYLRDLEYQRPDIKGFPNFNESLRSAMLTESHMFFMSVLRDNRPLLDFIDSDYTFLNQRLAEHYGIPGVYGEGFRKVALNPAWHRGGLLGQGAVLTVTSFNNRTSIVRRGKWILDNLLVAPPPPPPPDVPALNETNVGKTMTVREQMELHRNNPVCASCHTKIDPLGFSLENYDAVGAWRTRDAGQALDVSAVMPDGTKFDSVSGLKSVLMARKNQFTEGFIERLMTYALARGLNPEDMPIVRDIRRRAAADNYRVDNIVDGIVESVPFQERKAPTVQAKTETPPVRIAQQ